MKKFKGIILGMIFVFGMSFTADATVIVEKDAQACATWAWAQADEVPGNWSDWDIWELTDHYFDECMG